ncbi:hypothetical protein [Candidatus Hodarchaeum mangrovi]
MAPRALVIGIPLLLIGITLFGLFAVAGIDITPFSGTTGTFPEMGVLGQVNAFDTSDLLILSNPPTHPFYVAVKVQFIIDPVSTIDCDVSLYYQSSGDTLYFIPGSLETIISETSGALTKGVITTQIPPSSAAKGYKLYLRVNNKEAGAITITQARLDLQFTLFSHVIPVLLTLIGGIVSILAFIRGKKGPRKAERPVATGWEPTLQWGTASGTTKVKSSANKPKLAVKSTKIPKTEKKVVKKTVPAGGAQTACKFCGKQVSASAFFCPHCYGKLR